jgi:exopolysaccharide biosynthesis polyprenyl glycosylphosphotransferase
LRALFAALFAGGKSRIETAFARFVLFDVCTFVFSACVMTTLSHELNSSSSSAAQGVAVEAPLLSRYGLPRSPRWYQVVFDTLSFAVSFVVYYALRFLSGFFETTSSLYANPFVSGDRLSAIVAVVGSLYAYWLALFWLAGLYEDWFVRSSFDEVFTIVRVTFIGCCILAAVIFLDDLIKEAPNTRLLIFLYWAALCASMCLGRIVARAVQRSFRTSGAIRFPTLLFGSADHVLALLASVRQAPAFGYYPIGVAMHNEAEAARWREIAQTETCRLVGVFADIDALLEKLKPSTMLVSTAKPDHEELLKIAGDCERHGVTMKIVPDLYEIFSGQTRAQHLHGIALIEVSAAIMSPWQRVIKRLTDIVLSLLILLLGFPFWALIACIVALETPGGALYSQIRVGRHGVPFRIWKFRSMYRGSDKTTGFTQVNDARVTRFGRFIRKTHLDEIPQLWNILKGDMSLVGPRPEVPKLVEKFTAALPYYPRRLKVRPGLTGWWQIHVHNYDEDIEGIRKRLGYDFYYIENISFRLDLEIIIRTIVKVLKGHGQA